MIEKQKTESYIILTLSLTSLIWAIILGHFINKLDSEYKMQINKLKVEHSTEINRDAIIDSLIVNLENMKIDKK